jgi:hypothetical protein
MRETRFTNKPTLHKDKKSNEVPIRLGT